MIEENYVRLYANDLIRMAQRVQARPNELDPVPQRLGQARTHAAVMDAAKGEGHLAALITRLRDEARRPSGQTRIGSDAEAIASARRPALLLAMADALGAPDASQDRQWRDDIPSAVCGTDAALLPTSLATTSRALN
ncbi:hypothetical protein [Brevundimonas sp.]|jgi:hypothetical protein|uniref:hypothetical protein n=1 Tax=Brevundimonas sp. TaxID=1871086 RepID=UPI0037C168B2